MDVHILMGASGAGKSRWAGMMLPSARLCSANNFFTGEDGIYRWDPSKLDEAHGACMRDFILSLQIGASQELVVDNSNTSLWELSPYCVVARAYRANLFLHAFVSRPLDDCVKGTLHEVPEVTIRGQYHRVLNTLEEGLGMDASSIKGYRGGFAPRSFRPFQLSVQVH